MKKIIFAFAVLLSMAACKQNKPTQAVENETETTALTEAVDSINQQTRKRCGPAFEWMRVTGTLVNDDDLAVKEEFLNRNEGLKSMYKADDDNMAVLYITNGTARFCSFAEPERKVSF